jgi:carbon-monoxide dehydrogenase large subunit
VGSIPCFANAVIDAFSHTGVTDLTMPFTSYRVWQQLKANGLALEV